MDVLIYYLQGILSQCMHVSSHHNIQLKYLTILFAKYAFLKWEKIV